MTAGAKTPLPARSDGLDNVDGSSDAADIIPSARLGKLEMPHLRGLKADRVTIVARNFGARPSFNRLLTVSLERRSVPLAVEPGLKRPRA